MVVHLDRVKEVNVGDIDAIELVIEIEEALESALDVDEGANVLVAEEVGEGSVELFVEGLVADADGCFIYGNDHVSVQSM